MNNLYNILSKNNSKNEVLTQFKKDLEYMNILTKKVLFLKNFQSDGDNYQHFSINTSTSKTDVNQRLMVMYIISISFLKANTMIHVSDIKGNVKLFYNSGLVNLTGKQKRRRVVAVLRLIKLLYKDASFLFGKPIALHLNNVTRNKFLIVSKLKQKFFIKIIREFNRVPYNGCRKIKIRRKKYKKNFK